LLRLYRGHVIIVLLDEFLSAEVTDRRTGFPFPVKVSATREEGEAVLIELARTLIDESIGTGMCASGRGKAVTSAQSSRQGGIGLPMRRICSPSTENRYGPLRT
jgi:hypothetical protein